MADRMNVTHEYEFQYVVYREVEGKWGLMLIDDGTGARVGTVRGNGAFWEKQTNSVDGTGVSEPSTRSRRPPVQHQW